MPPTPQQEAVYAAVEAESSHVVVNALAGAGKTSTTVQAAARVDGKTGFVAFNKHIAQELQSRLGPDVRACTLHSLGFSALQQAYPEVQLDERKAEKLLLELEPTWFFQGRNGGMVPRDEARAVLTLARLTKLTLRQPFDELTERFGVDTCGDSGSIFEAADELLAACLERADTVDFDDMVWLPVEKDLPLDGFDTLFVDEVQDLNRVQQALAMRSAQRLVLVGDSRQAIYGFSGSDCEGLKNFGERLDAEERGSKTLPLSVTFRCPVAHVRLAQALVPEIEAAPNAIEGFVAEIDESQTVVELMPGDLALARRNAPLVTLAHRLILAGVPAVMRGRDIGKGLTDLITKLKPTDCVDLAKKVAAFEEREVQRLERRRAPEANVQAIQDRCQCLEQLCSRCFNLSDLRAFIAEVFDDETTAGKVILSSVHRAKGLEANRVVVIEPEQLPLRRKNQKPWEYQQELNLLYIAVTRAKQELLFAGEIPALLQRRTTAAAVREQL